MIAIGDEVEWDYPGGVERGQVLEISGDHVKVEYGPWMDTAWLRSSRVRLWREGDRR